MWIICSRKFHKNNNCLPNSPNQCYFQKQKFPTWQKENASWCFGDFPPQPIQWGFPEEKIMSVTESCKLAYLWGPHPQAQPHPLHYICVSINVNFPLKKVPDSFGESLNNPNIKIAFLSISLSASEVAQTIYETDHIGLRCLQHSYIMVRLAKCQHLNSWKLETNIPPKQTKFQQIYVMVMFCHVRSISLQLKI